MAKRDVLVGPFKPRFLEDLDQRLAVVVELKRRYQLLMDDLGHPSYAKDLLAQRAIFVAGQLETMETNALEGKPFDLGVYTQAVNCLQGLLMKLGLERKVRTVGGLKAHLEGKAI